MTKHFILATAGHVDHGKSSLVKALTGVDPDRLPEEKARGITIDLGFACLELPGPAEGSRLVLGIVDVPGHEDFVKNMVAGVGSIDVALLVVAADDGWMPQTEEHLQILEYLGVRQAVVALTKTDLPGVNRQAVADAIRDQLRGTSFAKAPLVPTSAVSGIGLAELKAALADVLAATAPPRDVGKPRLPIDRAFTLRGIGTVVTGTLLGGSFRLGQPVQLQPQPTTSRIRGIQSHGFDLQAVGPGARAALNLPDVALIGKSDLTESSGAARRGQVVTLPEFGVAQDTMDVLLVRTPRLVGNSPGAARPIKDGTRVQVHHGSGHTAARIQLLDRGEVAPDQSRLAQLRFDSPVFAFLGDRFIVRDWAEQVTLAGAIILDPDASRRRFRTSAQRDLLVRRAESNSAATAVETLLVRDGLADKQSLLLKSNYAASEIADAITHLQRAGKLAALDTFVAETSWWNALHTRAMNIVDAYHRLHPERLGVPLNEWQSSLKGESAHPKCLDVLLSGLLRDGFVQTANVLKRATHSPALPPGLQAAGAALRAVLSAKPLDPPSRKELAPNPASQQALRFLVQTGEAVELGEVILLSANYRKAVELITKFLRERGAATVSELRQAIGASRRIVVPLLEKLDRDGVTRREGDLRRLRS
jgi:selenocysteine-specific elongation factor